MVSMEHIISIKYKILLTTNLIMQTFLLNKEPYILLKEKLKLAMEHILT
jgi:hypothetical protein